MNIEDFKLTQKSEVDKIKDKITTDICNKIGMYDMYYLGQISIIETLVNYIDKDYTTILLKRYADGKDISDNIKKLAQKLLDKYSEPPKFEI